MCICINCRHIQKCQTYRFIEEQHYNTNTYQEGENFVPINTLIIVSINKKNNSLLLDWDVKECLSFIEQPGSWLIKT